MAGRAPSASIFRRVLVEVSTRSAVRNAFAVYLAWVAATYLLEGLPGALLRPEAVGLRLAYALVANVAIGLLLPLWLIRNLVRSGWGRSADFGFGGPRRAAIGVVAGSAAGYGLFHLSQSEPVHPLLVLNGFAQVWVVSVAEVLVCWGLVGGTLLVALRAWSRVAAYAAAAVAASLLFGVYHFAHSAPFNEAGMVAFLTGIGFATSAWWFLSRDAYGTVIFHNFFGVTGVLAALKAGGLVPAEPELAVPLVVTAVAVAAVFLTAGEVCRER